MSDKMGKKLFIVLFIIVLSGCFETLSHSIKIQEAEKWLSLKFVFSTKNFNGWVIDGPDITLFANMIIDTSELNTFLTEVKKNRIEFLQKEIVSIFPPDKIKSWFDIDYLDPLSTEYEFYSYKEIGSSKTFYYYIMLKPDKKNVKDVNIYIYYISV